MKSLTLIFLIVSASIPALAAKEVALSFDDSPGPHTAHFRSEKRTKELLRKLKALKVPPVLIFANPCNGDEIKSSIQQLQQYRDAGHLIGNHTCTHPRLDDVGFEAYSADAEKADGLLSPIMVGQKFFRFPYLNEGRKELRDQMRVWLRSRNYRNGMVSIDNDDYIVTFKINQAKDLGKKIDYGKVEKIFIKHLLGAAAFYDDLAVKTLGRSPKHVILLHEKDATVMFIESLVRALRKDGWKIISADEAYKDPLYLEQPSNTYAGNGIIAQIHKERTGETRSYKAFDQLKADLDQVLGTESPAD